MGDPQRYVSAWVAKGVHPDELKKYLHVEYTDDGDSLPSAFEVDSWASSFIDDLEARLARIEDTNWSAFIVLFRFKCKRKPGTRGKRLPFLFARAFPYDAARRG